MNTRYIVLLFLLFYFNSLSAQDSIANKKIDSIKAVIDSFHKSSPVTTSASSAPFFKSPTYKNVEDRYSVNNVPNPKDGGTGYISDPNDYLSLVDEQKINTLLWKLEQKTTAQIAIVMLPSIGTAVPKDFAVDLFASWGIGQADTDNGLLILTVMDQRRTEFEVGYGLEPILTDVVCYRIGTDEIVPYFKKGEFGNGIFAALRRIQQFLEDPEAINEIYSSSVNHNESSSKSNLLIIIPLLIYVLITAILSIWKYGVAYDIERSKDDYYDKYHRLKKQKVGCLAFLFPLPLWFFSQMTKKRLKQYRYAKRFSKVNGKELFLKDEWAENAYLENPQILEEKIKAVRYDVWVTEDESDVLILEYEGSSRKYSDCKECGYKTFGRDKTLVLVTATYTRSGEKLEYFQCKNCHYKEEILKTIPQLVKSSSSSGSSSFGGGSSGGSSSFGGGSSGGGGAGVSW